MYIDSKELGEKLHKVFPGLSCWVPTDEKYIVTNLDDVKIFIDKFHSTMYLPNLWECEEIAMAFVTDIRRFRALNIENIPVENRMNLSIGECFGTKFNNKPMYHQANIIYTAEGVHILDMQTKKIWPAKKGQDNIHFVRI